MNQRLQTQDWERFDKKWKKVQMGKLEDSADVILVLWICAAQDKIVDFERKPTEFHAIVRMPLIEFFQGFVTISVLLVIQLWSLFPKKVSNSLQEVILELQMLFVGS